MDWVRFLEENNVPFVTRGPNTKRGELSIKCPMCGDEDPSEHLGINLQTDKWGCHRDQSHRGISPHVLVRAVLNCSTKLSKAIVQQYSHSDPDSLEAALASLDPVEAPEPPEKPRNLNGEFKGFHEIRPRGISKRFFNYLMARGYTNPHNIIEQYDLRCAFTGPYKDRIIIPIRHNNELLGWTSRALGSPQNAPRYLASSEDVKVTVFNYDTAKLGGDRLFIVEGPFDAIKLDSYYDYPYHLSAATTVQRSLYCRATCTFGTSVTVSQIALLRKLVKCYNEAYVLFDQGADGPAENLAQWTGASVARLPEGTKDPGELAADNLKFAMSDEFKGAWSNRIIGLRQWVSLSSVYPIRHKHRP